MNEYFHVLRFDLVFAVLFVFDIFAFSLNSLAVRVPHNSSRSSIAMSDPESVGRAVAGRCWDWFYSKTNDYCNC